MTKHNERRAEDQEDHEVDEEEEEEESSSEEEESSEEGDDDDDDDDDSEEDDSSEEEEDDDEDEDEDDESEEEDDDDDEDDESYENETQHTGYSENFQDEPSAVGYDFNSRAGDGQSTYYDGQSMAGNSYYDEEHAPPNGARGPPTGPGYGGEEEAFVDDVRDEKEEEEYEKARRRKFMFVICCCCCCLILILLGIAIGITFARRDKDDDKPRSTQWPEEPEPTAEPTRMPVTWAPIDVGPTGSLTIVPGGEFTRRPSPPTVPPSTKPTRKPTPAPTMQPTVSQEPTITLPETFTLDAMRDTRLQNGFFADETYGNDGILQLRSVAVDTNKTTYSLIQFELADLPRPFELVQPPATTKVTLVLDHVESVADGNPVTIQVVKQPPTRLNINYLFYFIYPVEHALSKGIAGPTKIVNPADDKVEIDITDLVFAPLPPEALYEDEEDPTNMVLMIHAVSDTAGIDFHSLESTTGEPPRVVFDFDPLAIPGSTEDPVGGSGVAGASINVTEPAETEPPTVAPTDATGFSFNTGGQRSDEDDNAFNLTSSAP